MGDMLANLEKSCNGGRGLGEREKGDFFGDCLSKNPKRGIL
jgi:hypothetical protein